MKVVLSSAGMETASSMILLILAFSLVFAFVSVIGEEGEGDDGIFDMRSEQSRSLLHVLLEHRPEGADRTLPDGLIPGSGAESVIVGWSGGRIECDRDLPNDMEFEIERVLNATVSGLSAVICFHRDAAIPDLKGAAAVSAGISDLGVGVCVAIYLDPQFAVTVMGDLP